MFNPLPFLIVVLGGILGWVIGRPDPQSAASFLPLLAGLIGGGIMAQSARIAAQWEKALVFRLGKFRGVKGPGPYFVLPFFDSVRSVDTRILTLRIPTQQAITQDNVPISTDGVIFLRVTSPQDAVTRVQNYQNAIQQYAQTALRDVVGALTLDQILADREAVGQKIQHMVEHETEGWGLEVAAIRIQDIVLPEDLKRVMARQASAEREKRANITKSEGDREAAENLAAAATTMATAPGALQLRTLQTLDSLGTSAANTVVLAVPVEVMNAMGSVTEIAKALQPVKKEEPLDRARLVQAPPKTSEDSTQNQRT